MAGNATLRSVSASSGGTARHTGRPPHRGRTLKIPTWAARPAILFAAASLLNAVLHEVTHAIAASWLEVPAIAFQYRVDVRLEDAAPWQHAVIAAAGPTASGLFALLCAIGYRQARGRPGQLALLYLAACGGAMLCVNMISPVGDFARMGEALDLPAWAGHSIALAGFAGLIGIMAAAGRELRAWPPAGVSRMAGLAIYIVIPALVGTALATAALQPMPRAFTHARLSESLVWLVAATAAWRSKRVDPDAPHWRAWHFTDVLMVAAALLAVRGLVRGVLLVP